MCLHKLNSIVSSAMVHVLLWRQPPKEVPRVLTNLTRTSTPIILPRKIRTLTSNPREIWTATCPYYHIRSKYGHFILLSYFQFEYNCSGPGSVFPPGTFKDALIFMGFDMEWFVYKWACGLTTRYQIYTFRCLIGNNISAISLPQCNLLSLCHLGLSTVAQNTGDQCWS